MNRMSMLMILTPSTASERIRPSTVKENGEMRETLRFILSERVVYNALWVHQNSTNPHGGQDIRKEAQTHNVSDSGICLLTTEALKPLETVQLNLFFYSRVEISIPTIAEVIWVNRRSRKGPYLIGLRYLL
jgi:hypothetical protein